MKLDIAWLCKTLGSINPLVTNSHSQSCSVAAFRGESAGSYREAAQQEGSSPGGRLLSGIEDPNLISGNSSTCETKLAGSSGCRQSCRKARRGKALIRLTVSTASCCGTALLVQAARDSAPILLSAPLV